MCFADCGLAPTARASSWGFHTRRTRASLTSVRIHILVQPWVWLNLFSSGPRVLLTMGQIWEPVTQTREWGSPL